MGGLALNIRLGFAPRGEPEGTDECISLPKEASLIARFTGEPLEEKGLENLLWMGKRWIREYPATGSPLLINIGRSSGWVWAHFNIIVEEAFHSNRLTYVLTTTRDSFYILRIQNLTL